VKAYLLLAGGFLAIAFGQTLLGPNQMANVPQLPTQFGFLCQTLGSSTVCQVDRSMILNLSLPCPAGGLPCANTFTPGVAPPPGPCPSPGSVILTTEPAAYFCVQTVGTSILNWIRVAGTSTW
jgi:hypothetical protein